MVPDIGPTEKNLGNIGDEVLVIPCNNRFGYEHKIQPGLDPKVGDEVIVFRHIDGKNILHKPHRAWAPGENPGGFVSNIGDMVIVCPMYGDPKQATIIDIARVRLPTKGEWGLYNKSYRDTYTDEFGRYIWRFWGETIRSSIENPTIWASFFYRKIITVPIPHRGIEFQMRGSFYSQGIRYTYNDLSGVRTYTAPNWIYSYDWAYFSLLKPEGQFFNAGTHTLLIETSGNGWNYDVHMRDFFIIRE